MHIVFHLGAHCTDDGLLLESLLAHRDQLGPQLIDVPEPQRYRKLLAESTTVIDDHTASPSLEATILSAIGTVRDAKRLILSWEGFLSPPGGVVADRLYPLAARNLKLLSRIFHHHETEIFIAIRNPASLIPAMAERYPALRKALPNLKIEALSWARLIGEIRTALPFSPITIWRDEDSPLLWPQLLSALSAGAISAGTLSPNLILRRIMRPEGVSRLEDYLNANPQLSQQQRIQVTSVFLEKFARPEACEQDIALPDWTEEMITRLGQTYTKDLSLIQTIPGVRLLSPCQ